MEIHFLCKVLSTQTNPRIRCCVWTTLNIFVKRCNYWNNKVKFMKQRQTRWNETITGRYHNLRLFLKIMHKTSFKIYWNTWRKQLLPRFFTRFDWFWITCTEIIIFLIINLSHQDRHFSYNVINCIIYL